MVLKLLLEQQSLIANIWKKDTAGSMPYNMYWFKLQMAQISTIFLDYKTHPPIWEENGGAFYSPNVAYLAQEGWGAGSGGGGAESQESGAGSPLKEAGDSRSGAMLRTLGWEEGVSQLC